jgi:DNA-binding CsgD family transcriptional regulator/PAS domain-containing protein
MPALTARHARQLLDITECIYAAKDLEELARTLLPRTTRLAGAEEANLIVFNVHRKTSLSYAYPWSFFSAEMVSAWQQHMHEHPFLAYFRRTADGSTNTIANLVSQREWHRLALYNEFFRPVELEDGMGFTVQADWPEFVGLGVCRASWGFSSNERMLLDRLRPHVTQAWRNIQAFAQLRREAGAMNAALEALGGGAVDLDHTGRARFMSDGALRLLGRYFGDHSRLAQGHLPEKLRVWARRAQTKDPQTDVLSPRAPLVCDSAHGRLTVHLLASGTGYTLLLKEEPESVSAAALEGLGLTKRECEVLSWIAEGKTNADIAAILGLSELTVKRHAEDILRKLGVENRTAAAAVALRVAAAQ